MYKISYLVFISICFLSCQEQETLSDAYGNFEATETTISSEAKGQLLFFKVEEGQKLKAGELIALVDTTQLSLQRKQVQASINALPKKLRNDIEEIAVLKKQMNNLERERNRVKRLVEKKAATSKQLDDLNGEIEVIEKRVKAIKVQTQTTNRGILAETEPMLAQIDLINEQIRKSYLYNPINGTVLTKLSEPFEMIGVGTPLYRIAELDTMTVRFYASAIQLQEVKLNDEVEVLIDAGIEGFKKLKGTITWISEQAEFTPKTIQTKEDRVNLVYAVKASVPNQNGLIKIGMPAEINFSAPSNQKETNGELTKVEK